MQLTFERADFADEDLLDFLRAHLDDLEPVAPEPGHHSLDVTGLMAPEIRLWVARFDGVIVATGAIKLMAAGQVEIKSMRTDPALRGQGIGARVLELLLEDARAQGAQQVWLETGASDYFIPARNLYARAGFTPCEPFGDYQADTNCVFLSKHLPVWPPS